MRRTPTQATQAEPVRPSTRDPIAQWLDVFTSLLALPASEADRIRDELEDHLRTRVDDLLILGMTEPEAIQKAVTELGETAQLAQNFRSVRTHSRRRIAMYTALFAAAGLALTVSVAGLIPSSPSPAFAPIAAVQPEEAKLKSLGVDLPGGTLEATLSTIAEATGARLFVHWNTLESFSNLARDSEIGPIPAKDMDGAKILELMNSMLNLSDEAMLAVRHEGNLVEVANVAYFDRIETVTVDYDVSKLVPAKEVLDFTPEGQRLKENIQTIVEPHCWLDNGGQSSLTISGSVLTVRAPKRIHELVGQYIAKLEDLENQRIENRKAESAKLSERNRASSQMQIDHYEIFVSQQSSYLETLLNEFDEASVEYWRGEYARKELETLYYSAQAGEERAGRLDELAKASAHLDAVKTKQEFLREHIQATRDRIQKAEAEILGHRDYLAREESAAR